MPKPARFGMWVYVFGPRDEARVLVTVVDVRSDYISVEYEPPGCSRSASPMLICLKRGERGRTWDFARKPK